MFISAYKNSSISLFEVFRSIQNLLSECEGCITDYVKEKHIVSPLPKVPKLDTSKSRLIKAYKRQSYYSK